VRFAFDSARISGAAQAVLARVIGKLRQARGGTVTIDGYTDSIGARGYNLALSQRRAAAVRSFLISRVAHSGLVYQARGFGASHFVAPNMLSDGRDNPDGRRQNRRVVIAYRHG
jgi:outer membrane protein OmpA-like peptidoglycan-associated protein